MNALPVPAWSFGCGDNALPGQLEHQRYAGREFGVSAWLEQVDRLDISTGSVEIVREPPTILFSIEAGPGEDETREICEQVPVSDLRAGRWPAFPEQLADRVPLVRDAVAELLAAYDEAVR